MAQSAVTCWHSRPRAPADGGAGATYVLLKREKSRAPFDILQGAKRR